MDAQQIAQEVARAVVVQALAGAYATVLAIFPDADSVAVSMSADGVDLTAMRGGVPLGGFGG